MKLLNATLVSIMLAAPLTVFAQSNNTPRFDQRQANQLLQRLQQRSLLDIGNPLDGDQFGSAVGEQGHQQQHRLGIG